VSKIEQTFYKHGNTFEPPDCTMSVAIGNFHSKMTACNNKGIFFFVIIPLMESLKLNEKKQTLYWTDTPKTHTQVFALL
jgi:hypothetical protein